jgi:hypothetical protein
MLQLKSHQCSGLDATAIYSFNNVLEPDRSSLPIMVSIISITISVKQFAMANRATQR